MSRRLQKQTEASKAHKPKLPSSVFVVFGLDNRPHFAVWGLAIERYKILFARRSATTFLKTFKNRIMKTRKVQIRTNYPIETSWQKEMTEAEINQHVTNLKKTLHQSFKWEFYPKTFTHLVMAVLYNKTECCIYNDGWIMTEQEFESLIASRKDIKIEYVIAYHRGTSKF